MKFLVVRMRQMGDAIVATNLLNAIKRNFPESEVHFVLNESIAPIFEGHPAIDRIITFSSQERHSSAKFLRKAYSITHSGQYDVVIDLRSTINTLPFSLFSPGAKFRIGVDKDYTRLVFNHRMHGATGYKGDYDIDFLSPLECLLPEGRRLDRRRQMDLYATKEETDEYRAYLKREGVDFSRPVLLCGVVAKIAEKNWSLESMADIVGRIIKTFPEIQLIFNYAPGAEEGQARWMYEEMGKPANVLIDVKAKGMRELLCLAKCSDAYFGNEGGTRHIIEAVGKPSIVICNPDAAPGRWIAESEKQQAIYSADYATPLELEQMSREQQYALITADRVWERLEPFLRTLTGR